MDSRFIWLNLVFFRKLFLNVSSKSNFKNIFDLILDWKNQKWSILNFNSENNAIKKPSQVISLVDWPRMLVSKSRWIEVSCRKKAVFNWPKRNECGVSGEIFYFVYILKISNNFWINNLAIFFFYLPSKAQC